MSLSMPNRLLEIQFYPILLCTFIFSLCLNHVHSIGCFVCTSINRTNPQCEDTFNTTADKSMYHSTCWAGRKSRTGLFPATQCIKLKAEVEGTNYSIIARNCVVDNGDITSETEVGRVTHCGWIRLIEYNGRDMRGCLLACGVDGCNGADHMTSSDALYLAWTLQFLIYISSYL